MWAVLYGWTPEIFGTKVRGTACGIASALSRIGGMIAPMLGGILLVVNRSIPVYTSVVTFVITGFCVLLLKEDNSARKRGERRWDLLFIFSFCTLHSYALVSARIASFAYQYFILVTCFEESVMDKFLYEWIPHLASENYHITAFFTVSAHPTSTQCYEHPYTNNISDYTYGECKIRDS